MTFKILKITSKNDGKFNSVTYLSLPVTICAYRHGVDDYYINFFNGNEAQKHAEILKLKDTSTADLIIYNIVNFCNKDYSYISIKPSEPFQMAINEDVMLELL